MSCKTKINGTNYEITQGKTLVNNVSYSINNGKTFVEGTNNKISLEPPVVTTFQIYHSNSSITLTCPIGYTWGDFIGSQYDIRPILK